jgi:threonyl-tRNA synthetase
MFVVGPKDAEAGTVSVRDRIEGDKGAIPLAAAIENLQTEIRTKAVRGLKPPPRFDEGASGGDEY